MNKLFAMAGLALAALSSGVGFGHRSHDEPEGGELPRHQNAQLARLEMLSGVPRNPIRRSQAEIKQSNEDAIARAVAKRARKAAKLMRDSAR